LSFRIASESAVPAFGFFHLLAGLVMLAGAGVVVGFAVGGADGFSGLGTRAEMLGRLVFIM
jgi:hypothetical protein